MRIIKRKLKIQKRNREGADFKVGGMFYSYGDHESLS